MKDKLHNADKRPKKTCSQSFKMLHLVMNTLFRTSTIHHTPQHYNMAPTKWLKITLHYLNTNLTRNNNTVQFQQVH